MPSENSDNKRIAKNTILLYFRMIIIMLVTLYTSRVILMTLGVEDYGIYNVVGGIVAMFNFISGSLTSASQRFITFELGKGDKGNLSKIFSVSLQLHIFIAIGIAIVAEAIGVWFIYNKLQIPTGRLDAALWVFHFSILSMIIMFISVPYNALIVAHEKMTAFAMVSIVDAGLRLGIANSLLVFGTIDRLIVYGALMFIAQLVIRLCYTVYCKRNFSNCRFQWSFDKKVCKEMGSFASWSIFGNLAFVTYTQGLNLLLGMFFTPVVNAARGIAVQVQSAVNTFIQSFQTAINPQITKNYASGKVDDMISLVFRSSRFSYYLLMIVTIPVMLQTNEILKLWLRIVPDYTVSFLRVILLTTWINSIANPLIISVKATGKVKVYESTVGGLMILILPISYVFLKFGFPPITVFVVHLCMECCAMIFRIWNAKHLIHFSLKDYFSKVIIRLFVVTLFAVAIPVILQNLYGTGMAATVLVVITSLISSCLSIYILGLTRGERAFVLSKLRR